MDEHTLELLEFGKIRALVAARTSSALGRERAERLAPMTTVEDIRQALGRTTEMVEALAAQLTPPLGGLRDVRVPVRRAALGVLLDIDQLLEIRDVLELTGHAFDYGLKLGRDYPRLAEVVHGVADLRHLSQSIAAAMDEKGRVRDNATPELSQIRRELAAFEHRMQTELRRLLRSPETRKALRYPQATVCGDHHVLPVAVNYRHLIVGVVHRTSSTGETVFIEPAKVAEIQAEMALVKHAEQREIRRVLRRLTDMIGREASRLLHTLEALAELDLVLAKARFSRDFAMSEPDINTDGIVRLRQARHPLLEDLFRQPATADATKPTRSVVPISLELGVDFDVVVVTGPNTGGKTAALKTIGLACLMALSGLHVPASAGSSVPLLADVLADIGDEQSLEQSLSTFSAHMSRIADILRHGTRDTLVLLDELGAGTDPTEGAALGRAILDELTRLGCRAMVTTHLGDLKTYALTAPRAENAAVEFDVETLRPTYRLIVGQFGRSCAIKIARRLKLPKSVVVRAEKYLRRRRGRKASELTDLQRLREEAIAAREEAAQARTQATQIADEYRRKVEALQQEAAVTAEIDKARAALRPGDSVRVARFEKTGVIQRIDHRRKQAAVVVGAVEWELPLEELIPITLASTSKPPRR